MSARDQVLQVMAIDPGRRWFALELAEATHRPLGAMYPALADLAMRGLVTGGWEDPAVAAAEGRRPRRWYELTGPGVREAARHARSALPRTPRWRPQPEAVSG